MSLFNVCWLVVLMVDICSFGLFDSGLWIGDVFMIIIEIGVFLSVLVSVSFIMLVFIIVIFVWYICLILF